MQDIDDDTGPVEAADDERDFYGVSSWERRSLLNSASVAVYRVAVRTGQLLVVLLALLLFLAVGGASLLRVPSIGIGGDLTATRALAGSGHVIYSSFAGYYLGLAKFNPGNRDPIIVNGLIIAAIIHATYNATVGIRSGLIQAVTGFPQLPAFFIFVLLSVGGFWLPSLRKNQRYKNAY